MSVDGWRGRGACCRRCNQSVIDNNTHIGDVMIETPRLALRHDGVVEAFNSFDMDFKLLPISPAEAKGMHSD